MKCKMIRLHIIFLFFIFITSYFGPEPFMITEEMFGYFMCDWMFSVLIKCYIYFPPIRNPLSSYFVGPPNAIYNHSDFEITIRNDIIGQHLVHFVVPQLLHKHLDGKPKKPLSMSFLGPPGTGKTLLSKKIAQSIFENGLDSSAIRVWKGGLLSDDKNKEYNKLQYEVKFHYKMCTTCIFIFDNVEDISPGILDALIPFMDKVESKFSKSIFIFISNAGAQFLEDIVYEAWRQGIPREALIDSGMFTLYLKKSAFYESGGLQKSDIIKKDLIDAYLPFLPMEKDQVKQCIKLELNKNKMTFKEEDVEIISRLIDYYPPGLELYSKSGCKKITRKVELYFNR